MKTYRVEVLTFVIKLFMASLVKSSTIVIKYPCEHAFKIILWYFHNTIPFLNITLARFGMIKTVLLGSAKDL
jgi:hypothetical protein